MIGYLVDDRRILLSSTGEVELISGDSRLWTT